MKPYQKYTAILILGSLQMGYNIVSAPVMWNLADRNTMAWASQRYAAMMEAEQLPQDLNVMALAEIQIKADALCADGICEKMGMR